MSPYNYLNLIYKLDLQIHFLKIMRFFQGTTFNKLKTVVNAPQQEFIMYNTIYICMILILTQLFGFMTYYVHNFKHLQLQTSSRYKTLL